MKVTTRPVRALPRIIIHRKVAAYCARQGTVLCLWVLAQRRCGYTGRDSFAFSLATARENRGSPPSSRRRQH